MLSPGLMPDRDEKDTRTVPASPAPNIASSVELIQRSDEIARITAGMAQIREVVERQKESMELALPRLQELVQLTDQHRAEQAPAITGLLATLKLQQETSEVLRQTAKEQQVRIDRHEGQLAALLDGAPGAGPAFNGMPRVLEPPSSWGLRFRGQENHETKPDVVGPITLDGARSAPTPPPPRFPTILTPPHSRAAAVQEISVEIAHAPPSS